MFVSPTASVGRALCHSGRRAFAESPLGPVWLLVERKKSFDWPRCVCVAQGKMKVEVAVMGEAAAVVAALGKLHSSSGFNSGAVASK